MSDQDDKNTGDDGATSKKNEGGGGTGGETAKTFTQDDLDRIVGERLARERERTSDYDDLKKKASRLDEIEAANQSELEKAQGAQAAAEKRVAELEAQDRSRRIANAVRSEATKAKAIDADAVVALVLSNHDLKVGDDGQVAGADKAVGALVESKKHLFATGTGTADGGTRTPGSTGDANPFDGDMAEIMKREGLTI